MDDGKLNLEAARGTHADRLLRDDLLTEAFDTLERVYVEQWAGSPVRDAEARERIWAHLQALRQVRTHLRTVAETGELARRQLDELHGRKPSIFRR